MKPLFRRSRNMAKAFNEFTPRLHNVPLFPSIICLKDFPVYSTEKVFSLVKGYKLNKEVINGHISYICFDKLLQYWL